MLTLRTACMGTALALVSTHSWTAAAQAPQAAPTTQSPPAAQSPAASQSPAAAQSPPVTQPASGAATAQPTSEWKNAMTLYELGDIEAALKILRAEVLACEAAPAPGCSDAELAPLYMCVGIILSAGQNNHNGGVQAFKKALAIDGQMRLAPEYSTEPAVKAFSEARYGASQAQPAVPPPTTPPAPTKYQASDDPSEDDDDDDEPAVDPDKKHLFWLATGTAHYGIATYSSQSAQLGGALGLAGMPGETSGFTLGARVRAGALISDEVEGYFGAQMLVGNTWGPRKNNQFTFLAGGLGFENQFESDSASLTGHFLVGTSLSGLILAGGVNIALGDISYALFGLEIGLGTLL